MKYLIILLAITLASCGAIKPQKKSNKKILRKHLRQVYWHHQTPAGKTIHSLGESLLHTK